MSIIFAPATTIQDIFLLYKVQKKVRVIAMKELHIHKGDIKQTCFIFIFNSLVATTWKKMGWTSTEVYQLNKHHLLNCKFTLSCYKTWQLLANAKIARKLFRQWNTTSLTIDNDEWFNFSTCNDSMNLICFEKQLTGRFDTFHIWGYNHTFHPPQLEVFADLSKA